MAAMSCRSPSKRITSGGSSVSKQSHCIGKPSTRHDRTPGIAHRGSRTTAPVAASPLRASAESASVRQALRRTSARPAPVHPSAHRRPRLRQDLPRRAVAAWPASTRSAQDPLLQFHRHLGRERATCTRTQSFLDQLAQTFLCLIFLVSPNRLAKLLARIAILTRAHALVDVVPKRFREGETHRTRAHVSMIAKLPIVVKTPP